MVLTRWRVSLASGAQTVAGGRLHTPPDPRAQKRKKTRHGRLVTDHASRPRLGTQALGCAPHRTLVGQLYSADPTQRKYVLALRQTGPSAVHRTARRGTRAANE
jgi:hypothetical protein